MRYHWIRDQVKMKIFKITWKAGKLNLADFFTKAHPVHHHVSIRWKYVLTKQSDTASSEGVLIDQQISNHTSISISVDLAISQSLNPTLKQCQFKTQSFITISIHNTYSITRDMKHYNLQENSSQYLFGTIPTQLMAVW